MTAVDDFARLGEAVAELKVQLREHLLVPLEKWIPVRRYGVCRTVVLWGFWAFKFPRLRGDGRLWSWTRGVQANLSEAEWSGIDGVAPVLHSWLGGLVIAMVRCRPLDPGEPDPDWEAIGEEWVPRDRKRENVGYLPASRGGQLVWIDYDASWNGCPHEQRRMPPEVVVAARVRLGTVVRHREFRSRI